MKISVCFPSVNDSDEAILTARSIRETAGDKVEIVCCDDASAMDFQFPPELNVRKYRNYYRIGSGPSRHVCAQIATGDYMLMTDSHVRMEAGWLEAALDGIEKYPNTAFCGVCKGFTPTIKPFGVPAGTYYGADLQFIGPAPGDQSHAQVLEGVWAAEREEMAPLSCFMGACYLLPRNRFLELGGMQYFKVWGVEEQLMTLKFQLSGTDVRLMKGLKIWHRFRDGEKLPFHNSLSTLIFNKLFVIMTIFPTDIARNMIAALPKCADLNTAQDEIRKDWRLIEAERAHNRNIFTRDVKWLMEKFDIPML